MEFYKQFLQETGSSGTGRGTINLAVFGKHPGWDDHIPDIGLHSDTLVLLKRILYVRGIGGLIDSGAWENLSQDDVLPGFDHTFVGQRGGDAVIGRMWASTDGKGRSRYPMVVVAHVIGLPLEKCLNPVLKLLEELHLACLAVETDKEVLALIRSVQEELNQLASGLNPSGDLFIPSRHILRRMLEGMPLNDVEKHKRLLYEIRNKLEPFSSANAEVVMQDESHAGEHLRLPVNGFRDQADSYFGWLAYLRTQISDKVPLLLLSPVDKPWMDAIVGLFAGLQLTCLRASLRKVPCVTEIKYNIPEEFSQSVSGLLTGIANWVETPVEKSVFGPPEKTKLTQRMARASGKVGRSFVSTIISKLRTSRILLGAIAAVVLIVLILLILMLRGTEESPVAATATNGKSTDVKIVAQGAPEPVVQAWQYLSAANEWYPRFLRYARNSSIQETWSRDSDLSRILGLINSADFYDVLDRVGTVSNIAVADLSSLEQPKQAALTELALQVQGIENAIKNWSVRREAEEILNLGIKQGWSQLTEELKRLVPPLLFNRDLGPQINDQLPYAALLQKTSENLSNNRELVEKLVASGLRCLSGIEDLNWSVIGNASSVAVLNDALVKQNSNLEGLSNLVAGRAAAINEELLMQDSRYKNLPGTGTDRVVQLSVLLEDYQVIPAGDLPDFQFSRIFSREQLMNQLNSLKELEPDLDEGAFQEQWDSATGVMTAASQVPRVQINRREILAKHAGAVEMLEDLRSELGKRLADHSDPSGWYANLPFLISNSSPLHESWAGRIERLVPVAELSGLATDTEKYIQMRQLVDNWLKVYKDIEAYLDQLSLNEIPDTSSRDRLARHELLRNRYIALARESAIELADGLQRPLTVEGGGMDAFKDWQEAVEDAFRKPLIALEEGLTELHSSLEGTGEGSFPGLIDLIRQFWPDGDIPPGIKESYAALNELMAASTTDSLPELLEVFDQSQWPGVRWVIWKRVINLSDWPRTLADLNLVLDLGRRMKTQGLQEDALDDSLQIIWKKAMAAADNRQSRLPLWSFFQSMDWSVGNLSSDWQFDELVARILNTQVSSIGRDDAIVLRDSFTSSVKALGGVAADAKIRQFLDRLSQLTFEEGRQIDRELLINAGPGSAGWTLSDINETGSRVRYTWNSENLKNNEGYDHYALSFVLLESESGERFYLGTNEIPCGLFFDWINELDKWSLLSDYFPERAFGSAQGQRDIEWRTGPRAWTLEDDKKLLVAYDWQLQPNTQGVPILPELASDPSRFSPVNYISAPAGNIWAGSVGCRLPSTVEFLMASSNADSDIHHPNLRDAAWQKQLNYLKVEMANALFATWPDQDCFAPGGVSFPKGENATPATSNDDGLVWFREVGGPDETWDTIHNLRGNLAEILLPPGSGQYFVVGASALSPAEVVWDNPYPAPSLVNAGSSDVGFRLAFDAPVPLPGRILLEAIAEAPDPMAGN